MKVSWDDFSEQMEIKKKQHVANHQPVTNTHIYHISIYLILKKCSMMQYVYLYVTEQLTTWKLNPVSINHAQTVR